MLTKKDIGKSVGFGFLISIALIGVYETINHLRVRRVLKKFEEEYGEVE